MVNKDEYKMTAKHGAEVNYSKHLWYKLVELTANVARLIRSITTIPTTVASLRCVDAQPDTALERRRWTVGVR